MKSKVALVALATAAPLAQSAETNPIQKVIEMISSLQQKLIAEGEDDQKAYNERSKFCEDSAQQFGFEIKTGKGQVENLNAAIDKDQATGTALSSKIEDKSEDISSAESDLKEATGMRDKEKTDFAAEEKELMQVIDSFERAISVLTKEANGASMLQMKSTKGVTDALKLLVQGAAISTDDASKLTAFVQDSAQQEDAEDDSDLGAPAAAVTENQSGGIVSTLEGLLEKAQQQLDKLRKTEETAAHNYAMLKQSLTDQISTSSKDMVEAKTGLAASKESKATAEGELDVTSKDLKGDIASKQELHHACMQAAQEFEEAVKSRGEELKALAEAKKIVSEGTGDASGQTYSFLQVSLLQVSSKAQGRVKYEMVRFVRNLATKHRSAALAQLASRMNSVIRLASMNGADPFAKVRGLITDMVKTLEEEAQAEASQKAYCDKEMSETKEKKDDVSTVVQSLTTKVDQKTAASSKLKEQVATLQKELAAMAKQQAEAEQMRQEENDLYKKHAPELEQGISAIQKALKVLKDYYAKSDSSGESGGIINLLEVAESDFSKGLADMTGKEESAKAEFEQETKAVQVEKAAKEKDEKYKTSEYKSLDKAVAELSGDLSGTQDQLDAVNEYDAKVKQTCVAKPEPYEERKKRREDELAGLKQALTTLENESFLQQPSSRRFMAVRRH